MAALAKTFDEGTPGPREIPDNVIWFPQRGPQTLLLTCPIQDLLYGGARGGGKTDGFLGKWVSRWKQHGKHLRGIFLRRTYDELDEVIARSMEIFLPLGATYSAGKRTWYFPDGARLKMRSLQRDQDASKYQGHSYTDVYIDEAGNFPDPAPLDKLRATLRNTRGIPPTFNLSANPGGPGHEWIKKRYVDPAPEGLTPIQTPEGEIRIYIPSKLDDNQLLAANDPNYTKRLKMSGPAWLVQAWLNGDWNATPEGGLVKAAWFQRYGEPLVHYRRIIHSWDTGIKDGDANDPTVCTVWGEHPTGYHLLHVFRKKLIYPDLKRAVNNMAKAWIPDVVLIEDKASGQSLIQDLKASTRLPVIAIDPKGVNKVDRLIEVSGMIEAGLVALPESASWLLDFELELTIFPLAAHDDQVDSMSQFLKYVKHSTGEITHKASGKTRAAIDEPMESDMQQGWGRIRGTNYGGF